MLTKYIFFQLEIEIKNTEKLEIKQKSGYTFVAVHPKILLQDEDKLKRLLKPMLRRRVKILDANGKLSELYKKFSSVKAQAMKDIEKRIQSLKDRFGSNEMLSTLEDRISKLNVENNQNEDRCEEKEKIMWSGSTLNRFDLTRT